MFYGSLVYGLFLGLWHQIMGPFDFANLKTIWKTAVSNVSWSSVRSFCRFTWFPFFSAAKSFSLILTQVDKVFFGTPYCVATSSRRVFVDVFTFLCNEHLSRRTVSFETLNKTFEIILNTSHSLVSKDQYSKFKVCFHFYPSFL